MIFSTARRFDENDAASNRPSSKSRAGKKLLILRKGQTLSARRQERKPRVQAGASRGAFVQIAMLNWIWLGMVLAAVLIAGATGRMEAIASGAVKGAETAVTIALGLIGIMTVWMGIMRLAERSGFVQLIARFL